MARKLVLSTVFGVSAQTLAEFYSLVTGKKPHVRLSPETADQWIGLLSGMPLQVVDLGIVQRGIDLSREFQIAYYDAALLAAAERLGATTFYSEDLSHNQLYGSVRVLNPFLEN